MTDIGIHSQADELCCVLTLLLVTGATNLQPPPAEGVFFAQPVTLLSSDSESDIDTDDAQTVIFKSSPYSSPGPGILSATSASPVKSSGGF